MQTYSGIILTLLAIIGLVGCQNQNQNQKNQNHESDEKAIRNIVQSYQEAYNQQDAAKLTAQWAPDATYSNPITGESAEGKETIEKLFKDHFADGKKRHVEVAIKSIQFPDPDEAVENGVMRVNIDNQPTQQLLYQTEYTKENGHWLVKSLREIESQEPSSNYEHLKELTWLIGKWQDSDENVDIIFDNHWDKYKNFITQHFDMKIYGQDNLEGKQLIAWDPAKKIIRSWVFDSDGGFGEGTWEKVDKSWYATMHFTLGDGRIASSINIFTPIDDDSYTFASIEREVDGEILPNMDPVTVEKIK